MLFAALVAAAAVLCGSEVCGAPAKLAGTCDSLVPSPSSVARSMLDRSSRLTWSTIVSTVPGLTSRSSSGGKYSGQNARTDGRLFNVNGKTQYFAGMSHVPARDLAIH